MQSIIIASKEQMYLQNKELQSVSSDTREIEEKANLILSGKMKERLIEQMKKAEQNQTKDSSHTGRNIDFILVENDIYIPIYSKNFLQTYAKADIEAARFLDKGGSFFSWEPYSLSFSPVEDSYINIMLSSIGDRCAIASNVFEDKKIKLKKESKKSTICFAKINNNQKFLLIPIISTLSDRKTAVINLNQLLSTISFKLAALMIKFYRANISEEDLASLPKELHDKISHNIRRLKSKNIDSITLIDFYLSNYISSLPTCFKGEELNMIILSLCRRFQNDLEWIESVREEDNTTIISRLHTINKTKIDFDTLIYTVEQLLKKYINQLNSMRV